MKTSVLVTVYNRPEMVRACLRALAVSAAAVDEVVVSDDGSDAASVRRMETYFSEFHFPLRYVRQEDQGYRLAAARNQAVRAATGDYLISLDCDVLLLPDAVGRHLALARPGRFLAGNRAWLDDTASARALAGPLTGALLEDLWLTSDRRHLERVHRQFVRNVWLRYCGLARRHKPKLLGCHFSLFRADVERVNGFDERFEGWGLEDDDFALRLHAAGVRGRSLIHEARALHLWHASVTSRPTRLRESPNWAYFHRAPVPPFCANGLTACPKI